MTVECTAHNQACLNNKTSTADTPLLHNTKTYIAGIWQGWLTKRAALKQQRQNRKALKSLSTLDERSLRDIGISRSDIMWATRLPSDVNASQALNEIRSKNIAMARWQATHKEIRRR